MSVRQDDDRRSWRVLQAALVLIVCKDERRLPRRLRRRILRWMQRSPENLIHLFEIARVDQELDRLKLHTRSAQLSAPPAARSPAIGLLPRRAVLIGCAAVVGVCLGLSIPALREEAAIIRHVQLDDGSVMHVLRGSDFDIEFTEQTRLILLPHGEAVFEVAKDSNRPFIVRSKLSDSIAIGTRFGVATDATATTTTVSEGHVRVVVPASSDPSTGTSVRAGQEFRVVAGTSRQASVVAVNAERRISWAEGWLEFEGETIGEAVRTFNRFSDVKVKIAQPGLSSVRLRYGRFELDKPQSFDAAIKNALITPVKRSEPIGDEQPNPK